MSTFHMKFCSLLLMSLLLHPWIELRYAGGFGVCITVVSVLYVNTQPRIYDLRSYFFGRTTITHFSKSFAISPLFFFFHFHLSLVDCSCCILLGKSMIIMIIVYYFGRLNYYLLSFTGCVYRGLVQYEIKLITSFENGMTQLATKCKHDVHLIAVWNERIRWRYCH